MADSEPSFSFLYHTSHLFFYKPGASSSPPLLHQGPGNSLPGGSIQPMKIEPPLYTCNMSAELERVFFSQAKADGKAPITESSLSASQQFEMLLVELSSTLGGPTILFHTAKRRAKLTATPAKRKNPILIDCGKRGSLKVWRRGAGIHPIRRVGPGSIE
jgi:hypothetical protein